MRRSAVRYTKLEFLGAMEVFRKGCHFGSALLLGFSYIHLTLPAAANSFGGGSTAKRPITVVDAIEMTQLGERSYLMGGASRSLVAHYSPDGKRFVVVVKKGIVEDNTNEYSLLLFVTATVFRSPAPTVLVCRFSATNRPAIQNVKWLDDNETVVFLGENPGEYPQVYTLNTRTGLLEKRTEHPTPVVSYDISRDGREVIYKADPSARKLIDTPEVRHDGIVITDQQLYEILGGDSYTDTKLTEGEQVFFQQQGRPARRIPMDDVVFAFHPMMLSPDGRYALISALARHAPESWALYQDRLLRQFASEKPRMGAPSRLTRYWLLDAASGQLNPLLDVPSEAHKDAALWAPDSKSIVLSGLYLPLDVADPSERDARTRNTYVVEVRLPGRDFVKITDRDVKITKWDKQSNTIWLESGYSWKAVPPLAYAKAGSSWEEVNPRELVENADSLPEVALVEDSNTPPKLFVSDAKTHKQSLLLDLNPQFAQLSFGKVETVRWKATDGKEVQGGLYLPPDFSPNKKYPLVIQTHGFSEKQFRMDGPWSSAFAARPLVAKGFLVLQVGGSTSHEEDALTLDTPQEGPRQMAAYEGGIDYLDRRGLIDRNRVGIIGFSRTDYTVKYTLTHSRYAFAAATVSDGVGGGYFEYVAYADLAKEYDALMGAPPFEEGLSLWLKNSPSFNVNVVNTPIRIESFSPANVLAGWEWYSILSRLEKPVEFVYIPGGTHLLVKPWDRQVSQQGNVDWFSFWLKDEEDSDASKVEQYERWRRLRAMITHTE